MLEQRRLNKNYSSCFLNEVKWIQYRDHSRSSRQPNNIASHEKEQQLTAGNLKDLLINPQLSDSCYSFMYNTCERHYCILSEG